MGLSLSHLNSCPTDGVHLTSADLAAARAEGRVGGRRKKLDASKRHEIAESVVSGRKSSADMARLYNIGQPTVSRIVAQRRTDLASFPTLIACPTAPGGTHGRPGSNAARGQRLP